MMRSYILLMILLSVGIKGIAQKGREKENRVDQFRKDLYAINKKYYNLKAGEFTYIYSLYADEKKAKMLESFPLSIVTKDERSYYKYEETEVLYDTAFTVIINHEEKRVNLVKKQDRLQMMSFESLIDTAAMNGLIRQVETIRYEKNGKLTTYYLSFAASAQLVAMSISFESSGLIKEISVLFPEQKATEETGSSEAAARLIVISCKTFSPTVKQLKALDISTYFKLFGNGQYILNDPYQSYNLNNLYEEQDL